MAGKRYTKYEVEGRPRRRWRRILLWSCVALVLLVLFIAAGSYLWFRAQVSSANDRVAPEVLQVLQEKPSTTLTTQAGAATAANGTAPTLKEPSPSAMNLLVIGSDRRSKNPSGGGRSDTLMIVHIDPEENYLSVLSLPRDLRVDIPGHGKGKLNTAFAFGGPALAIKTIEQTTGVDINHYMEVGFDAFSSMVDSLGGVYVDVDNRYYNPLWYYEPIDIQPGYQLLSGTDALDYVRFRHDHNMDFGRMERQQRFMSAFREQAMGWDLPFKLPGLISALFQNITTDLDANGILRLAKWGIGLNGDSIRGITLRGSTPTINGAAYVVATEDQMARAVTKLLYKTAPEDATDTTASTDVAGTGATDGSIASTDSSDGGEKTTSTTLPSFASSYTSTTSTTSTTAPADFSGVSLDVDGASGRSGEAAAAAKWLQRLGATVVTTVEDTATAQQNSAVKYPTGLLADAKRVAAVSGIGKVTRTSKVDRVTLVLGEDFVLPGAFALGPGPNTVPDAAVWKQWAGSTPYAVEAPAYIPEHYSFVLRYPDAAATYNIKAGGGQKPAFRMLYASTNNSDQVLGITETTWLDAPAASKGLEVTHDGVVFTVVRNDTKVERVWWKHDGVLYFVSNSLSHWLDQEEMLKIAESMIVIPAQ